MSLQFVAGAYAGENSRYIYRKIIERSQKESGRSFYVLVPEQYSMQAQSELVKMHPKGCITNIDVLNFTRLSRTVFDKTGFDCGPVLDDTGKLLVLRKTAGDLAKDLPVLGSVLDKNGAAALIKSLISEFMQYRITPETLEALCAGGQLSGAAGYKLADIKKLYSAFLAAIDGKYITAEEMPGILAERIDRTDFLKDTDIVLDGFTGFVPIQMEVIGRLFEQCRSVTVVLTADPDGETAEILKGRRRGISKSGLFKMSGETALSILDLAKEKNVEILSPIFVGGGKARSADLTFLCENIYRNRRGQYALPAENIALNLAADPKEEIGQIAETICRLVREEGYRYRDIALITGDPETYGDIAEEVFSACGIPYFSDRKKPVVSNPAVEFIRSAVGLMTEGFSYRSVFRYLRCGMTEFSAAEADLLETYVLAAGIRGFRKYGEEWTRTFCTVTAADLEAINDIRARFYASLEDYVSAMRVRSSSAEEKTRALYALIEKNSIQEKCARMAEAFEAAGENALYREYEQICRIVIDDLDKLTAIIGAERMSLKTYETLTEAMFLERKLGITPPGTDRVVIGDVERSRLSGTKVLFLAGCNEGALSASAHGSSLLSASEREQIALAGVALSPDERELLLRQRFYLYLMCARPEDKIFLSCAAAGPGGHVLMPSPFIEEIRKIFPEGLVSLPSEGEAKLNALQTGRGRERMLTKGFQALRAGRPDDVFFELCAWYANTEDAGGAYEIARSAAAVRAPKTRIDPGIALYGEEERFSATRFDCFAGCAFAHFIKYGLRLKERDIFEWTALDRGTLVHAALQYFVRFAGEKNDWKGLGDAERKFMSDRAFDRALAESAGNFPEGSRNDFAMERIRKLVDMATWAVTEQIKRGRFTPFQSEMAYNISGIRGSIDRLDLCRAGDISYVRVIDYKTGGEKLDLSRLCYGSGIQLPLYLKAAMESNEKIPGKKEPAGIYYFNIGEPVLPVAKAGEKADPEAILETLKLTGLTREEREILDLTDEGLAASGKSDVIKATLRKDGMPAATSEIAKEADFGVIYRYTGYITENMRERILKGEADIEPLKYGDRSACDYCVCKGICRFDRRIPGYRERICESRSTKEALKAMNDRIFNGDELD